VGYYAVSIFTVALGFFFVATSLVAWHRIEPRPMGPLIAVGVLNGSLWLASGGALLFRSALSSTATRLALIIGLATIAIAMNALGWPIWWKRLGDPDAWRGKAR
jgi:hypothetical protein